jgi:hypothetical protein
MDYPERFFSKMFAWGRPLELARRFAIYSGLVLFFAVCVAGAIVWARRSQGVRPYFIHISDSGEWTVWSEKLRGFSSEVSWAALIQESIADKYARDYFEVPAALDDAEALWCKCGQCDVWNRCRVCCAGDARAYEFFTRSVLPTWRKKFGAGETQRFINRKASPVGAVDERGGYWKITGELADGRGAAKKIVAFMGIGRSRSGRAEALGFYVSEFYFYWDR